MESILQGKFTDFQNEDTDYPTVTSIKKVGFMPDPKPTIASQSVLIARERKEEQNKPKHFIMKKFQKIKGTFEQERELAKMVKRQQQLKQQDDLNSSGDYHMDEDPAYNSS